MNLEQQRARNTKAVAATLTRSSEASAPEGRYQQREIRQIAAFRLRDAANRIATLVGMSDSPELRADLLGLYDRLMAEEREMVMRSMTVGSLERPRATPKASKRMA